MSRLLFSVAFTYDNCILIPLNILWIDLSFFLKTEHTDNLLNVLFVQVLRWGIRNATSSSFISSQVWRCPLTVCTGCRWLSQPISPHPLRQMKNQGLDPSTGQSESGLSLRSLVEMGFADTEAEHVCASVSQLGGTAATHALSTLRALFVLGLNATSVLKVLEKCPEVYTVKEAQLQQRINNLRKLGLVEGEIKVSIDRRTGDQVSSVQWYQTCLSGSLQRVVVHYPRILTVPAKRIRNTAAFLREKCLFTVQQVTGILRDSPAIVLENTDHLEYKFQVSVLNMWSFNLTPTHRYRSFCGIAVFFVT